MTLLALHSQTVNFKRNRTNYYIYAAIAIKMKNVINNEHNENLQLHLPHSRPTCLITHHHQHQNKKHKTRVRASRCRGSPAAKV
jgi:hypothetical protein